jgi:formylglycine-generating enzyme required for sulfatase activity
MKIFISYRRKDSAREVGRIRDRLKAEFGEESVFRDLVDIPSGVDFQTILEQETNSCDVMLVVIGPLWANITYDQGNKRLANPADWTRIEVETGLRRLQKGAARVFPLLVLNASMPSANELPETLRRLLNQNAISIHDDPYFDFDMERLIRDIKDSSSYHPVEEIEDFEPQTIFIPQGTFWMGSEPGEGVPVHETPQHEVNLPAYCIGKDLVTNAQYEEYIRQTGKLVPPIMRWHGQRVPGGLEDQPVLGVTWVEALAYCQWLSQKTNRAYSLPNEGQWEKACRGSYGCETSMGRVLEWTCSLWGEKLLTPDKKYYYPWKNDDRNNLKANSQIRRVIRGHCANDEIGPRKYAYRRGRSPKDPGIGNSRHSFRVLLNI